MSPEQSNLEKYLQLSKRLDSLAQDHRDLKEALDRAQEQGAFYQTRFKEAGQVMEAVKKGYAKTPEYRPEFLKDPKYMEILRGFCRQAVYSTWNVDRQASTLLEIYQFVKQKVREMMFDGQWDPKKWTPPGKRTIDRRVNECADRRYWDGPPPLLALKSGLYCPNPALFEGEAKQQLLKLSMEWK